MNPPMSVKICMNTSMMLTFKQELYIHFKIVMGLVSFQTTTVLTV